MVMTLTWANLFLRVSIELGIVAALGYWGFETGQSPIGKMALGIGAPLLAFGIWGFVSPRKGPAVNELMRLIEELAISGLAAVALYATGKHTLGYAFGLATIINHALVYVLGGRLLK